MIKKLAACCLFLSLAFPQNRPEPASGNLPVQPLGASDLLSLSVYNSPELSRLIRISAEGDIQVPMLKNRIAVAGLMPADVEKKISAALTAEGLLVEPTVTVTIVEYFSRPISVMGAVRKPLTFQANGPLKLLDALSRAEGLATSSGPDILVSHQDPAHGELIKRIPIRGLIDLADPELNLTLSGGEEIRVPEAGKVFVVGNVRKPGTFAVQDGNGLTVMKALAMSEGLMPFAAKQAFIYRRESAGNGKSEIPIELKRILDRKTPDMALEANDILYIPDNSKKRLSITTLERVISFGSTTASGLLIWGAAR
jgi:polysaccharide export outer membrane protein